jgi:RHS repeat-associated protein
MKKPMQAAKKKTAAALLAIVSSVAFAGAVEASLPRLEKYAAPTSIKTTRAALARVRVDLLAARAAAAPTPTALDPRFSLAAPRQLGGYGRLFDIETRSRAPVRLDLPAWGILKTRVGVLDFSLFGKALRNQRFSCVFAVGLCYGAWTDPVTGLAYHRARWYDARTASWLSEDPLLDVDSTNLYAFVGWGPQSATDPLGTVILPTKEQVDTIERSVKFAGQELQAANQRVLDYPNTLALLPQATANAALGLSNLAVAGMDCISFPKRCFTAASDFLSSAPAALSDAWQGYVNAPPEEHAQQWGGALADAVVMAGPAAAEFRVATAATVAPTVTGPARTSFGGVTATTEAEGTFLRNAAATFEESSVFGSATRFEGNIVIQRSDIPLSVQNVRRMASGNTPFVRNSAGEWEKLNLHHVGRRDGQLIEVLGSHNTYNPVTGGPLHIPGPGGPVRDAGMTGRYWMQRLQSARDAGLVPESVLNEAGL